jgi:protocatechuate 3,4-dioxygenase beta subunit-like protein
MSTLVSQRVISEEIEKIHASAQAGETQPRLDFPPYRSAVLRHPVREPRYADPEGAELVAPVFGRTDVDALESDLTIGGAGDPIGERIMVRGRVLDGNGRRPKLVPECTYPLTGLACVSRVYTDLAVFLIQPEGVVVRDLFGTGFAELTTLLDVPLVDGTQEAVS